jgi:MtN3 and saliva related transmembrane protein
MLADNAQLFHIALSEYLQFMFSDLLSDPHKLGLLFGSIGAFCTTAAFVPQVLHTFQSRDVSGISLGMYSVFTFGVLMWLVYGVILVSWPMIIANTITVILAAAILVMKLKFQNRRSE